MPRIETSALAQLFHDARTHRAWRAEAVDDATLRELWDLTSLGPTAMNTVPLRAVFVRSQAAKARLKPCLDAGNVDKTMAAPVTAIIAGDTNFHEQMATLAPHAPGMKDYFAGMPAEGRAAIASQGSSLQGAYFIVAARALGLDCGPMGGFNRDGVDAEFLAETQWKSNFLINLGHGDPAGVHPRAPRLDFSFATRIL